VANHGKGWAARWPVQNRPWASANTSTRIDPEQGGRKRSEDIFLDQRPNGDRDASRPGRRVGLGAWARGTLQPKSSGPQMLRNDVGPS